MGKVLARLKALWKQKGIGQKSVPKPEGDTTGKLSRFKALRSRLFPIRFGRKSTGSRKAKDNTIPDYRFFRWRDETHLVAFEWTSDKPGFFSPYPAHLEWRQAHIVSRKKVEGDYHVLMQVVAGQLGITTEDEAWRGATRVVLVSDPQEGVDPLYWSAVFSDGRPVYDRETFTADPAWIRTLVQQECTNRDIDQLIATKEVLAEIRPESVVVLPLEQFNAKWKLPDEEPLYFNTRYQPVLIRSTLALGLFLLLLAAGYFFLLEDPDKRILVALGLADPPASPTVTHPHVIDWQAFATTCQDMQDKSWPAAPGWTMETLGCSARGMQDSHHQPFFPNPALGLAYRIYRILPGHHEWLTTEAAAITTRNWDGTITFDTDRMTLSRPLGVKLLDSPDRVFDHQLLIEHTNRNFLGTAGTIEEADNRMIVRTSVRDGTVFPLLQELENQTPFGIYTVSRTKGELTLTLGAPNILPLTVLP